MVDRLAGRSRAGAAAGRRLADQGLVVGTAGNLSSRVGDLIAITAGGPVLRSLTADQVSLVELDGRQIEGELAPSSELELRLGFCRQRLRKGPVPLPVKLLRLQRATQRDHRAAILG